MDDEVDLTEEQFKARVDKRLAVLMEKWKPVLDNYDGEKATKKRKTTLTELTCKKYLGDDCMEMMNGTTTQECETSYDENKYFASRNCPYIPENMPKPGANSVAQLPTWASENGGDQKPSFMSEYNKQMTNSMKDAMNVPDLTNEVTYNPCTELKSPPIEEDVFCIADMNPPTGVLSVGVDTSINTTSCGLTAEMKDLVKEQCEAVIKSQYNIEAKPDCHRCYPDSSEQSVPPPVPTSMDLIVEARQLIDEAASIGTEEKKAEILMNEAKRLIDRANEMLDEPRPDPAPEPAFEPGADFIGYMDVWSASDLIDQAKHAAKNGKPRNAIVLMTQAQDLMDKNRDLEIKRKAEAMKQEIINTVLSDQPKELVQMENVSISEDGTCYEKIEIDNTHILIANENRRFKSNRNLTTGEVHSMVVAQLNCSQEEEDDYVVTDDYLKSIVPMHTFKRFLGEKAAKVFLDEPNSMESIITWLDTRNVIQPRSLLDVLDIWLTLYGDTKPFEDNMEQYMSERH